MHAEELLQQASVGDRQPALAKGGLAPAERFAAQPHGRIGLYLPARLLSDRKLARCTRVLERCGLPP
jgi:hypothetical protein